MSINGLGWQPAKGDLPTFLCGVLRHKLLDHLKRQRHTAGSFDDRAFRESVEERSATASNILGRIELKQRISKLMKRLSRHRDLQEVVAAATATDGGHNSNQQIADVLGTTPRDVANRKKRILRILLGVTK